VLENRVLRRIFETEGDGVTRQWRKLHNEGLSELYSSANIIRVIKLRTMRWVRHVAHMRIVAYRVWVGNPEGKIPLG